MSRPPAKPFVEDVVEQFLALKIARAPKTQAAYSGVLKGAQRGTKRPLGLPLAPYFSNRRFDTLHDAEVAGWFAQRVKGGAQPTKHRVSKIGRAFFRYARERGYTTVDLAAAIDICPPGGPRVDWLSWEEIHEVIDAVPDFRHRMAVAWLFYTGCRVGEACEARQKDVRLVPGLDIYQWSILETKTHVPRKVWLPDYLRPYIERSRAENHPAPESPVVWDCEGRGYARRENTAFPISPRMINSVLERARDKMGLQTKLTAHVARHSYCTLWVDRYGGTEESVEKLSRQVGTSASVLRKVYVHHKFDEADWAHIKQLGTPAA
jgi:integrase